MLSLFPVAIDSLHRLHARPRDSLLVQLVLYTPCLHTRLRPTMTCSLVVSIQECVKHRAPISTIIAQSSRYLAPLRRLCGPSSLSRRRGEVASLTPSHLANLSSLSLMIGVGTTELLLFTPRLECRQQDERTVWAIIALSHTEKGRRGERRSAEQSQKQPVISKRR
jgi:hypothetical protein